MHDLFGSVNQLNDKELYWRIVQNSGLLLKNWGAETVVYNPLSGETHQIDDFSATVLEQMRVDQCTEELLLNIIFNLYPSEDNSQIKQLLAQVINNFDQIGLIEPQY